MHIQTIAEQAISLRELRDLSPAEQVAVVAAFRTLQQTPARKETSVGHVSRGHRLEWSGIVDGVPCRAVEVWSLGANPRLTRRSLHFPDSRQIFGITLD